MKSRKHKKIIICTAAVLAVTGGAGAAIWQYQAKQKPQAPEQKNQASKATAEVSSLSNTIVGTGNLEADTPVSLKIPSGITISEVKVESGDHVSKGDALATVDSVSVLSTIEEVEEQIDSLDAQIAENQEADEEETITASVSGRVKKIYIEEGETLADCMLENGALMLLSIDGKLAVDLEKTEAEVSQGETVTVTLSSETQVEGTVESVENHFCTVTLTDSGVGMGDTTVITNEAGETVGSGITYIHQPLEVTGTMGSVTDISVSEDQAVESGDTLLTLEEDSQTVEYAVLHAQREALSQTLTELLALSKDGTITATMDGTIEDVYVSEEDTEDTAQSTSTSGGTAVQAVNMSYRSSASSSYTGNSGGSSVKLLKLGTSSASAAEEIMEPMPEAENQETEGTEETEDAEETEETERQTLYLSIGDAASGNAQMLGIVSPKEGEAAQTSISTSDGSYTGSISWNPGDAAFLPGVTYQAGVTLLAGTGYSFAADSISQTSSGVLSGISLSEDGTSLSFTLTFPELGGSVEEQEETNQDSSQSQEENGSDMEEGKTENGEVNQQNEENSGNGMAPSNGGGSAGSSSGSMGGASQGGTSATQSGSSDQTEDTDTKDSSSSQYSTDTTAFTISGDDTMLLSVSVDELDINSVSKGQQAEVTFDAIEEAFEGTVTKVGNTASASGGVAKYTVEISIPKQEEMKAGMNASATIVIEERENVVTIPVNALQERGEEVFVYTEQEEDGTLSGEQKVVTGLSDGENVEITEGLSEGDVVYYQKTGSQNTSSQMEGMPGGEMSGDRQNREMGGGPGGNQNNSGMGGSMGTPPER